VKVRVRFGAGLSRLAGMPRVVVELDDDATVADLLAALAHRTPDLNGALSRALAVLGGRHLPASGPLHDGDEVSLLLPVAGGAGAP